MGAGIAGACSRVHNPAPGHDPEGGQHKHRDPPRSPVTAFAGLMALALLGAIASSDFADATVVDLGTLTHATPSRPSAPMTAGSRAIRWGLSPRTGNFRNALLFGEQLFWAARPIGPCVGPAHLPRG